MDQFAPACTHDRAVQLPGELHSRLRRTHFGIDNEIQQLLDAFAPWYRFAEAQDRPRVIGLWGMTGTGKSSLVRALVKAAGLEDHTYWLDAGQFKDKWHFGEVLSKMEQHHHGRPFVVVVDEFQHARTMRMGEETEEGHPLRRFWELLDTGRAIVDPEFNIRDLYELHDFLFRFRKAVGQGLVVRKGRIAKGIQAYRACMGERHLPDEERWAVPKELWVTMHELHFHPKPLLVEVEQKLSTLDHFAILQWLDELLANGRSTRILDAGKALVILLGNLDELYAVDKEPLAELDPDVLLHRHRNIGLGGVQQALLRLFRIEQVARMGTDHIVFPPIGRQVVDTLVQHAVDNLSARLSIISGHEISVSPEWIDHVRRASAIAVMGARPVVQAVQNTLPMHLSRAIAALPSTVSGPIHFTVREDIPIATYDDGNVTRIIRLAWPAAFQKGSGPLPGHLHAVAVHEAGHVLCGLLLLGHKPLQACVHARNHNIGGFVIWDRDMEPDLKRSMIVPRLALGLGGWAAERVVFGPDGVSAGSSDDIRKVSSLALSLAKESGLGDDRLHHAHHPQFDGSGFRTTLAQAEAQARQWVEAAEVLAVETIQENRELLDRIVGELEAEGSLGMKELEELFRDAAPIPSDAARHAYPTAAVPDH